MLTICDYIFDFLFSALQKPANVLVSSSGRVKLADFGIVSESRPPIDGDDDNDTTIMNYTVVGTTRYMSPERLHGKPYTKPSDVWSVGLVLLEIARGDSPFEDISSVVSLNIAYLPFGCIHFQHLMAFTSFCP